MIFVHSVYMLYMFQSYKMEPKKRCDTVQLNWPLNLFSNFRALIKH